MRTKLVLAAAVLAAGLAPSMAQVYSLNVVGYVNQTVQANKWYMWGNPLKASTNTTAGVLSGLSGNATDWDGALVYAWHGGWGSADTYVGALGQWLPGTLDVAPGTGFFFYSPTNGTVTFVGEVVTTNDWQLASGWNCVASAFPTSDTLVGLGLLGQDNGAGKNDLVYRYNNGYNAGDTYVNGLGWLGTATSNGPVLNVAEGIFYQNAQSAAVHWVKSFTIP